MVPLAPLPFLVESKAAKQTSEGQTNFLPAPVNLVDSAATGSKKNKKGIKWGTCIPCALRFIWFGCWNFYALQWRCEKCTKSTENRQATVLWLKFQLRKSQWLQGRHTHTHYVHYWVWIAVWSAISCMLCETQFIGLLHSCNGWANHLYFRWILRCLVAGIFRSVGTVGLNKWPGKFRALNQCNFRITPHYSQPACLFAMHFCYISVLPHPLHLYMCTFMCIRPLQFC